ncbi:MAG: DUF554 domain-containing protein [Chloroflexi bacterium]|nr:MAG: DUF554 domain-containing protein [Chloroflexota bacterium]
MGGTVLNVIAVLFGGTLGLIVGNRLSKRMQESIITSLALVTLTVGMGNAFQTGNPIITLLSVAIGVLIGELLRVDLGLEWLAGWLQARFGGLDSSKVDSSKVQVEDGQLSPRERFITGFVTASLVFCVGPLTMLGSIQDGMGLQEGFQALAIKSTLDGFAAMAFAASFGVGVLFTTLTVFFFQGGLALLGALAGEFMTTDMMNEMTAAGGVLLIGLAIVMLEIKPIRIANFLPALIIAPLLVAIAAALGIAYYPAL